MRALMYSAFVGSLILACSAESNTNTFDGSGNSTSGSSGGADGSGGAELDDGTGNGGDTVLPDGTDTTEPNPDAFWEDDPPPEYCGPDDQPAPEPPGGTPECPDDKNREGCACDNIGEEAACWPGLRANRNLGICKDGVTTCVANGEVGGVWGACEGYKLPKEGATEGANACKCFSAGQWKLDSLSPCFVGASASQPAKYGATSDCENDPVVPLETPDSTWTDNTVKVDCAGHFKLCYTLRAGDAENPQDTDCIMASVCTEEDYVESDVEQAFPALPGWATTSSAEIACAEEFVENGGYGEMSVVGQSITCDDIAEHVFLRVQYCPLSCNDDPDAPECQNCSDGGSGEF